MEMDRMLCILVFVFSVCIISAYGQKCFIKNKHNNLLTCAHDNTPVQLNPSGPTWVQAGTKCTVTTTTDQETVTCIGPKWMIGGTKEISIKKIRHKRAFDTFLDVVVCILTLFSCFWDGRAGNPDYTPPKLTCPPPISRISDAYQTYAKVTWTEPIAWDERDGKLTPKRVSGRASGRHFPEGGTVVEYEAKDNAGNRGSCKIIVNVEVVKCPPLHNMFNGYYICALSTEFIYGVHCTFGCYMGFDLHGSNYLVCQKNGQWSDAQPECKPWKCNDLGSIEGAGQPKCSDNFNFRSICEYDCGTGYDMPPKVSKALVCTQSKTWRKHGYPRCIDIEPPKFKECPDILIKGVDSGGNTTVVNWKEPLVEDNSGKGKAFLQLGDPPGSSFTIGIKRISYYAKDDADNKAPTDCLFSVIVRDIRCPRLFPKPYMQYQCESGYRAGAQCNVSCDPGKKLNGTDHVGCNRSPIGLFGEWNWPNRLQPKCEITRKCVDLTPPENGAVVCDNWEGGQYCQIQCRNLTEMPSVNLNTLYVCDIIGEWYPKQPTMKTCRIRRRTVRSLTMKASFYFYGECTDDKTRKQIAENFIAVLRANAKFKPEVCANSQQCNTAKVQITCGKSTLRKRHADNSGRRRDILEANIAIPVGDTFVQSVYLSLYNDVQAVIMKSTEEIFGNITTEFVDFVSTGLQINCPSGAVKSKQSLSCVDCPEGTFYMLRSGEAVCESCRKGTYQNETGQHSCIRCPYTTTTQTVGATILENCKSGCTPGRYSLDGLQPCSPCEQGFYQLSYGQSVCKSCPESKSTLTTGAISISECKEFDVRFAREGLSDVRHELLQPETLTNFTLSLWLQLTSTYNVTDDEDIMAITLYNAEHDEVWSWRNFAQVIRFNRKTATTYLELPDTRWHHIVLYSRACDTSISIDGMPLPVDHHNTPGATCSSITLSTVSITAGNGTKGVISQLNIWNSNKYDGFFKHRCYGNDVGNLLSWKSMEDTILSGAYLTFPSQCDDFNNCASNPCQHGSCEDKIDGFICTCYKGFQGTQCDINIDDCEVNLCMNNGTCEDGISTYTCNCETNYTGQFCEIEMVDGEWSDWGNWTECSTSCGNGTTTRKRLCNNPTPDNGGEDCVGNQFDTRNCNNTDCPVCPELHAPLNGTIQCDNDTVTSNCTLSCDDGFDFDMEPLPLYYCGPETYHVWNFETVINPARRFPKCVAIKMPEKLSVSYAAHYRDLYCEGMEIESHAVEQIYNNIISIITNASCVVKETCEVSSIRIVDCYHGNRSRRDKRTAGFSLVISSHPTNDNLDDTASDLDDTFEDIHKAVNNGEADVVVLNETYTIDDNLTDATGEVECGPGATRVSYYCIPCGQGSYLYMDYCVPCPVGTYQDREGQHSCIDCPKGRSTIGAYSTGLEECIVAVLLSYEGYQVTGVIPGSISGVIVLLLSAFLFHRHRKRKTGRFSMGVIGMNVATSTKTNGQFESAFEFGSSTKTSYMVKQVLLTKYMSTSDEFSTLGVYRSKPDSIELKIGAGNVTQDHPQVASIADTSIVSLNVTQDHPQDTSVGDASIVSLNVTQDHPQDTSAGDASIVSLNVTQDHPQDMSVGDASIVSLNVTQDHPQDTSAGDASIVSLNVTQDHPQNTSAGDASIVSLNVTQDHPQDTSVGDASIVSLNVTQDHPQDTSAGDASIVSLNVTQDHPQDTSVGDASIVSLNVTQDASVCDSSIVYLNVTQDHPPDTSVGDASIVSLNVTQDHPQDTSVGDASIVSLNVTQDHPQYTSAGDASIVSLNVTQDQPQDTSAGDAGIVSLNVTQDHPQDTSVGDAGIVSLNVTQDHPQDTSVADASFVSLNEDINDDSEDIPALSDVFRGDIDVDDPHDSDNEEVENVPRTGLDGLQKSATENEDIHIYLEDVHDD